MNKGELVKAVAENAGLTLAQAKAAVDAAINSVSAALKAGDKVSSSEAFDLTGRRVNHVNRGLYIINGKKVMVK